jgi:ATP-dependent DNA helicase RecG
VKRPALPINLDALLRQRMVEGERVEYKAGWNPESVLHTLCAFANDFHNLGGGYAVIGVEEKGGRPVLPPKGIAPGSLDAIQKELLNLGFGAMQPQYHPIAASYVVGGRTVLVLWAPGGEVRPYKAKVNLGKNATEWGYFIRKGSSTVRARGAEERELLGLAATVPFDDRFNQTASLGDLSPRLMAGFLREVGSELAESAARLSPEALGRQMNIVGGPKEASFPKNVGLLFFNQAPQRFFPATQIDVVWFPDGAGGDRFDEKVFQGPLDRITRDAIEHIDRNYLKETVIKHPDRPQAERFWNFPRAAVEEAVVNAVYHRSYEIREPVEVRITPDDLVVLSFPGPDRSIRMEDLRAGKAVSRRYRNRRIGEFLKELDLTEGRSTGIPKILRVMKQNGSPAPQFESDEERTSFLIRLPVHRGAAKRLDAGAGKAHDGAHDRAHDGAHEPVSERERGILKVCLDMPKSSPELLASLGYQGRTGHFKRALTRLLHIGALEMTLPGSPRSKNQKYRLTNKGRQLLLGGGAGS